MIQILLLAFAFSILAAALLARASILAPRQCRHCDEMCASGQTLCPGCKARQDEPVQGMKL